jgi:hypothetical protein
VVTSSMPGLICALPWQLTDTGASPNIYSTIDISCGARSHVTLISY